MKINELIVYCVVKPDKKNIGYTNPVFSSEKIIVSQLGATALFSFSTDVKTDMAALFLTAN